MDWTKQSYLEINDLKQRIDRAGKDLLLSNMLILSDKLCDGRIIYDVRIDGTALIISVEVSESIDIMIKLDGYIIDNQRGNYINSFIDISAGEHKLELISNSIYTETVKTTLIGYGVRQAVRNYEMIGADCDSNSIYVTYNNKLFSARVDSQYPLLLDNSYNSISTISYLDNDISKSVTAYIENGSLKINDNNVVTIITDNVSSVALVKPLNSDYHYHIIYVRNDIIYMIEKTSTGFGLPCTLGSESANKVVSLGNRVTLYRTILGRWHALEASLSGDTVIYTKESLDVKEMPVVCDSGNEINYYVRNNGKYYLLNNQELIPYCIADLLVFIGTSAIAFRNGNIRKIEEV